MSRSKQNFPLQPDEARYPQIYLAVLIKLVCLLQTNLLTINLQSPLRKIKVSVSICSDDLDQDHTIGDIDTFVSVFPMRRSEAKFHPTSSKQ